MYEIELYEDRNGKSEIQNYLKNLRKNENKNDRIKSNKIRMYIQLLSEHGLDLREPYIKKLDEEIWELRPIRDRILFASGGNNKFILLSIFMKQTQKTPKKEIRKAKKFYNDYKRRVKDEQI